MKLAQVMRDVARDPRRLEAANAAFKKRKIVVAVTPEGVTATEYVCDGSEFRRIGTNSKGHIIGGPWEISPR